MLREFLRARDRIANAESHIERLIGIVLFDRLIEFAFRLDIASDETWHRAELPDDFFASALSLDVVNKGIKQEFEWQLAFVDHFIEIARLSQSESFVNRWANRVSYHPNRYLNWHYSNYLAWIKMARNVYQTGHLADGKQFVEAELRVLERLFDFPSASRMSMGISLTAFLGTLTAAKSRLILFDQYLHDHRTRPEHEPLKGNAFGSRLELRNLQNGKRRCQRIPTWIKTNRAPCIPTGPSSTH